MLDIAPSEFLLVAFVALVVIGPKDLPKAMRFIGYWVGRARAVGRQFRAGFDEMVREAELEDMEKKWKEENERIMREHPMAASPAPPPVPDPLMPPPPEPEGSVPRWTEQPQIVDSTPPVVEPAPAAGAGEGERPASGPAAGPVADKAAS